MKRETIERIGIGILSPIVVAAILAFSTDFSETASKTELREVQKESKIYTDEKMKNHENEHNNIHEEIAAVRESNIRLEKKVDKVIFLLIGKK